MTPKNAPQFPRASEGIRPIVRTSDTGNLGLWIFLGILLIGGVLLFQTLNGRRTEANAPTVTSPATTREIVADPPPLVLPGRFADQAGAPPPSAAEAVTPTGDPIGETTSHQQVFEPGASASKNALANVQPSAIMPVKPSTIYAAQSTFSAMASNSSSANHPQNDERVLATRLSNPSLTVPKGTVMPAVLESALDSTRPGAVRAIISRDIMGFDGTRVLIPRGSRLIGEYSADIKSGQNRAHVVWTRLMRPDAVIINLDSPAADPLGRTGVKGEVNTHFFARFGSAILQSVLDLGVGVGTQAATRAATNNTMVVAVSPTVQPKVSDQSTPISPTLTVEQGTSLSVFVAHDLDFSTVDN